MLTLIGSTGDLRALPAPASLSATSTNGMVSLIWPVVPGATSYNLKRATVSGGPYAVLANLSATNYTDSAVVGGTAYYYVTTAVNATEESTNSVEAAATPSGSVVWSPPWQTQNIGAVGLAGSAGYANALFTVTGSGADMYGAADAFRFVYLTATGDCTIIARVVTVQNVDPWSKAGVMIRESLAANSANAFVGVTPGNGTTWQYRSTTGGSTSYNNTAGLAAPYWVRMVRSGNTFTGYRSADGVTWVQQGTMTITMASTVYIGLAVTAHNNSSLCTATFDNVTVPPQWPIQAAPSVAGVTNRTVVAGNNTTVNATVSGYPVPSLQWRSNSVALPGQTNAALGLNNVQYTQNGTVYSLFASNSAGAVTNSMTLTVIVTPAITGLDNQAAAIGTNILIPATVSGVPTPALRWRFNGNTISDGATGNGSTISGSTTDTLAIDNAQAADSGVYSLVASNAAGVVTNGMTLTVSSGNVAPFMSGLTNQTAVQGSHATFSASVSGLPLPTLQWRVNGADISDATNSSLIVSNVQYAQNEFVYSLVASNIEGAATNDASLFVLVPPAISQQPTNLAVTINTPATFSVSASGVPAVRFQWRRNGSPISNATNSTYSIANAPGTDNGAVFSVVVSNSVSVLTSSNATLTVLSTMAGAFRPTNNATGISPDQQLRIVFSGSTPKLGSGKLYVRDAADNSLFATIDTSQFQTFSLFSATISNAALRSVQGSSFYYMPIAIYGSEAWITLTNRFVYNRTYYVNADAGLFRDAANASFPAITGTNTWRFSTRTSGPVTPTTSTGPTNLTVALDGAGDFATVQGASDWIPQNNTLLRTITIQPGVYRDYATFAQNRHKVRIVGAGANRTNAQIFYPYPAFANGSGAGTLRLESSDIYVRNLTIDNAVYLNFNGVTFAGPIQTVITTGNRLIFDNVLIKGGQDTLYTISGITYFNRCEIWGSVDFIYGAALTVFDKCDIVEIRDTGGPITAPNTDPAAPYGLVFTSCNFPRALVANGYPYNVGTANTTFQRPWRQDGYTAIINCAVGSQISTKGWAEWGNRHTTCRARESGTTLIGGGTVTPTQRQMAGAYWLNTIDPDYVNNPSIDPDADPEMSLLIPPDGPTNRVEVIINTNDFTLDAIYGNPYYGLGTWRPTTIPTITTQPTNLTVSAGLPAVFSIAAAGVPSPAYQWQKNGTNLAGATSATLNIASTKLADNGVYTVLVSNSAGTVVSSSAVLTIPAQPSQIASSYSDGTLSLSWPSNQTGSRLLAQTNSLTNGLGTNWFTISGAANTNQISVPINVEAGSVFFQLVYP